MEAIEIAARALWLALLLAAASVPGFAQEPNRLARAEPPETTSADAEAEIGTQIQEIERLYRAGLYAEALQFATALTERATRELGPDHHYSILSVNSLAVLYRTQGRYAEAEPFQLRALASSERVLGAEHPDTLASVNNLAGLYELQGRYAEAEPLYLRALAAKGRVLGAEHPDTLTSISNLALLYQSQARYAEAEPLYLQVLAARERIFGAAHPDTFVSIANLGRFYESRGRHAEAEPLYLRALTIGERVLGAEHPYTLVAVSNLAVLYELQGRYAEAEPLHLRALGTSERQLGAEHPLTIIKVSGLAHVYELQGRYGEAEPLFLRALAASERTFGTGHPETIIGVINLAGLYKSQGRFAEAEPHLLRALAQHEHMLGAEHPNTLTSIYNLAVLYSSQDRYAEAEPLFIRALTGRKQILGIEHRDTIAATAELAIVKLASADSEALRLAETALSSMRKQARLAGDRRAERSAGHTSGIDLAAFAYARAAWPARERTSLDQAFEALQLIDTTSVGHALARSAALATLNPASRVLALEREDVLGQIDAVDSAFASAAGTGGGGAALAELQTQRATLFERLTATDAALKAGNPRYFQLIRPQPVALDSLREGESGGSPLLRADEALILLTPGDARFPASQRRGFAFAVTREGAAWAELPLDPEALAALITEVREGTAIVNPSVQQPVPRKQAKALHDALFGAPEIARLIADKPSWIVSPQGDLLATPFAALVTRDPQGDDDDPEAWASTAWLGVERALAIVPEVHMLRALRGPERSTGGASAPYFGIADPAFKGQGKNGEVRSAASYYRGAAGSPEAIIALAPLPSTRAEAEAVARALGAGPEALLLGSAATEAALRARAPQLADSRVIHFATHALVAGEMGGLTQPALALMPPTNTVAAEESNDGLLTAAEAATLKLNADWVILSACNTAAGEDSAAEGLSGLARSFFYAGAASLLVSQWKVRDDSGAMLVAETVKAFAADPSIGRAEALRRAIRTVSAARNARGESFAHPQDWAPFMLVGVDR